MSDWAWYNEIDPYAADWLDFLIIDGHIAPGYVDRRSIVEVQPADLRGFRQCHFFAGIGGWSYALRLAGVPDNEPVWTGSCPCQPFSAAGKRKGAADERHLWPEMYRLIAACKPERVFGEQVEAAVRLGWIDGVFADLAREDYACGFAVLGAHSVGAPHIRQRIYWVANSNSIDAECGSRKRQISLCTTQTGERSDNHPGRRSSTTGIERLADANGGIAGHRGLQPGGKHGQFTQDGCVGDRLADAERDTRDARRLADEPGEGAGAPPAGSYAEPGRCGVLDGGMGDTALGGVGPLSRQSGEDVQSQEPTGRSNISIRMGDTDAARSQGRRERSDERADQRTPWSSGVFIPCADGKARRVKSEIQPLAHGVPARVGKLRAAGNAIVPQVAAEFIKAAQKAIAECASAS